MTIMQETALKRGRIVGFKCKECERTINPGNCGEHRSKTGHKNFEAVYE